ncbi:MAG: hypothetical protein KAS32_23070 [Candidatus Peribacteraceae bacterium]|nr:hypothetical protein [Candidatus Peribacteraceae bacterium]
MIGAERPGFALVKVTDLKTNDSVTIELPSHTRSMRKAREDAISILKSRKLAKKMGLKRSNKIVADYELPDDVSHPNDLTLYRRNYRCGN